MSNKQAAVEAVRRLFAIHYDREFLFMCDVAWTANKAARAAGRKGDLVTSVYQCEPLLPKGSRAFDADLGGGSSMYSALNPFFLGERSISETAPVPGFFDVAGDMGPT